MELTEYGFKNAVGAFFEMPTSDARKILPAHLQPLEVQHQRSILAITAFPVHREHGGGSTTKS